MPVVPLSGVTPVGATPGFTPVPDVLGVTVVVPDVLGVVMIVLGVVVKPDAPGVVVPDVVVVGPGVPGAENLVLGVVVVGPGVPGAENVVLGVVVVGPDVLGDVVVVVPEFGFGVTIVVPSGVVVVTLPAGTVTWPAGACCAWAIPGTVTIAAAAR